MNRKINFNNRVFSPLSKNIDGLSNTNYPISTKNEKMRERIAFYNNI